MYCPHFHLEDRFCEGICSNCPYGFIPFLTNRLNYECSDCHGKFSQPVFKFISCETKEIAYPEITATKINAGYNAYVCPFCGKIMIGMNS